MIFISILTLIVAKALPSLNSNLSSIYFTRISAIIFVYAGVLSFNSLYIQSIGSGIGIYSGLFHVTQVSHIIEVFLLIIGSFILIAWPLIQTTPIYKGGTKLNNKNITGNTSSTASVEREILLDTNTSNINYSTDYSLIVLFSTMGATLLISSSDLVSMYLSIELQSFGVYVLSTLYRDSESSTSAGLKYFLLGGLSSCLILLGAGLIYAFTGLTNFESIYSLISVNEINYISQGLSLGLILIIIGFLFKIAAAPLHNWSPDVYDDTPTIVTIWLTIMPKISILILLLELYTQIGFIGGLDSLIINTNGYAEILNTITTLNINSNIFTHQEIGGANAVNSIYLIKNLLLISSLLSLIIGTVVGLSQTRIKRLLAYSTISHIGFILLALAINTEQSIDSLLFYIIQYTITNLNVFLIIIALSYIINHNLKDIRYISELKGQFFLNPLLSLSLSICLFSMAGIPPLIGFFSKQFVLYSAIQSGYYFIAVIAIIVSVVSASYYLKIIKVLHQENVTPILPSPYPVQGSLSNQGTEESGPLQSQVNNNSANSTFAALIPQPPIPLSPLGVGEGREGRVTGLNKKILLTNFHSFLISSLTLSILLFIFKPSLILNSTQLLSLSLFNF
uniref:NADH-ubiquinone oxidoreductase chain 2 n=1 Tax=Hypsizygus marmoreus TaxID=39966 RepID=A0A4D6E571_HYPMA|nr:NADH dehydrogenase subunit 2 [Hypsizygus marmoreus]QBZ73684.1 NADH dehydrogenase subunit 2 [Hypsizygus marmoreus]QKJ80191.1 NADH dehydrogenase subunit 2 [Hypsizygus marmoreus]